ncbi:lysozyme [Pseudomonas abyssi]|uniref:lysozyme n=1 Tax=Pseudomonas abyssi TaxID=170540 RepID=UPI003C7D8BE4
MRVSQQGLALIKEHEGLRLDAYLCPAKVWTIGYGHTGGVQNGQRITAGEAERLLLADLQRFEQAVNLGVKVPLTQGQFDALASFAFNVGVGAFRESTLLRLLNHGDYQGAARQFDRWVYGGGQVLPGLVNRRADERALFEEAAHAE